MPIISKTLSCGTPLVMEPMSGVKSVGVTWLLPAGNATDPDNRQGMAPMLSELLMRGAGGLDSRGFADAMDTMGVSHSVDSATIHMRMGFSLLGTRLMDALPLAVDMVLRPRIDQDAVEPTRDLAMQALEGLSDDPQERAVLAVRERHNPAPINRSGLGTAEGLAALTREELIEGWRARAKPVGSVIAIAGDLDAAGGPEAIASRLDALLAGWSGAAPAVQLGHAADRGSLHHIEDKSSQVQIVCMHDAPPEPSPDCRLERLVSSVLSGGMASRLFAEVREKRGLCYAVSQSYATDRDYGRCMAYVGTQPERAQESLDVLLAELQRINTPAGALTAEELQRALIGIRSSLIFSGESTGARASGLASDQYRLGRPRSLEEIDAAYASITLDQVNAYLARRTLGEVTIVTLGSAEVRRG